MFQILCKYLKALYKCDVLIGLNSKDVVKKFKLFLYCGSEIHELTI